VTTAVDLLAAINTHLTEFELPPIASVHVGVALSAPQVTVQLTSHDLGGTARELLAWADTLTDVTAQAWRVPQCDSVHLSVTGLLPGAASVRVYSGLPVTDCGQGADLAPGATTTIPLTMLRHAATIQEART
jgi:hypothetical protein